VLTRCALLRANFGPFLSLSGFACTASNTITAELSHHCSRRTSTAALCTSAQQNGILLARTSSDWPRISPARSVSTVCAVLFWWSTNYSQTRRQKACFRGVDATRQFTTRHNKTRHNLDSHTKWDKKSHRQNQTITEQGQRHKQHKRRRPKRNQNNDNPRRTQKK